MPETYRHDCLLMAKDYRNEETLEQQIRLLYGESKLFKSMPGRFTFPTLRFFDHARTNPHLFGVLPSVLVALYNEGFIDFSLSKEDEESAYFEIIRL